MRVNLRSRSRPQQADGLVGPGELISGMDALIHNRVPFESSCGILVTANQVSLFATPFRNSPKTCFVKQRDARL